MYKNIYITLVETHHVW